MSGLDDGVKQILINGFQDLSKEVAGMRSDLAETRGELAAAMHSIEDVKDTRHELRNEMNGHLGEVQIRLGNVEREQSEKRGRDRVLGWLAGGGAFSGVMGGLYSFFKSGGPPA